MRLIVYSRSESFKAYFPGAPKHAVEYRSQLTKPLTKTKQIYLLHISSMGPQCFSWLTQCSANDSVVAAICSDKPDIAEMLESVQSGAKAYCNSYMRTAHYQQLIRLLSNGQSWFPPQMLQQAFELAHQAVNVKDVHALLEALTSREKDVTLAVCEGMSNKQIADQFAISERTVKTHLTNIFKKLQLRDRVALVLYLK